MYQRGGPMNCNAKIKIKNIFIKNHGYAKTRDIVNANIHRKYLKELLEEGNIYRLKRGLYKWNELEYDSSSEIVDVVKIVPKGVICLVSALSYHDLTTSIPAEYQVAVHRKSKVVLPDYPPIKLYFFTEKYYQTGIDHIRVAGNKVKIYDMEKTICDCFRLSNEINKDILLEGIKEYMKRRDRNIDKLMKYAKLTRTETQITKHVEALL